VIRLLRIQPEPLDLAEVVAAVSDTTAGGVAVFVGAVRDHDEGKSVVGLEYSAHPTALARLDEVAERVAAKHDLIAIAAVHRVGELQIGDAAVIVAAAAAHRGEAFDGSRDLIDDLKESVPIWKHQRFADGTEEWVGTP
jgi:molybdopterin synthase catalytic subunit